MYYLATSNPDYYVGVSGPDEHFPGDSICYVVHVRDVPQRAFTSRFACTLKAEVLKEADDALAWWNSVCDTPLELVDTVMFLVS